MTDTDKAVQNRFIAEQLDIHGQFLIDAFREAIDDKSLIDQGKLIGSLSYNADYAQRSLSVSFLSYGRIHDLKSRNKTLFESPDTNALIWGIKKRKPKNKKRNKQWYAKTAYGSLGRLTNTLMYGLSDIERRRITASLQKEQTIKIEL